MEFNLHYYNNLLKLCNNHNSITKGKQLHVLFLKKGILNSTITITNRIIQMYIRCGSLTNATKVFDEMPERNTFTWNTMIEGCMKLGARDKSWALFNLMPYKDDFSWNVMVSGYAKVGELSLARMFFDHMPRKDGVAWNSMIHGYVCWGYPREALNMFRKLNVGLSEVGCRDGFVLATAIRACTDAMDVECGKQIHARIVIDGVEFDSVLGSCLVNMYSKCGDLDSATHVLHLMQEVDDFSLSAIITGYANLGRMDDARRTFDSISSPCIVVWNSLISGYVSNGEEKEALVVFNTMRKNGLSPDCSTFASIFNACSNTGFSLHGKQLHAKANKFGVSKDTVVASSLIDMYSKCRTPDDACKFFDELEFHDTVLLNSMIDVYNNYGRVEEAKKIFDNMENKSLITWNSMLAGFSQNGRIQSAISLFCEMNRNQVRMDEFSLASVISSCSSITSLEFGEQVFARATIVGLDVDLVVRTSLIDLYCKCGFVNLGRKLFNAMIKSDQVSWNSMLTGYATNGHAIEALDLFLDMRRVGIQPNYITFTVVLSSCSHCGLIEEARKWFHMMQNEYRIEPGYEHYCCMVDLLARAGCLEEAMTLIKQMPFKGDVALWSSVLGGCVAHGNKSLGKEVADIIIDIDPENSSAYVQLSGMFATLGEWEGSTQVRDVMRSKCIEKDPGISWG